MISFNEVKIPKSPASTHQLCPLFIPVVIMSAEVLHMQPWSQTVHQQAEIHAVEVTPSCCLSKSVLTHFIQLHKFSFFLLIYIQTQKFSFCICPEQTEKVNKLELTSSTMIQWVNLPVTRLMSPKLTESFCCGHHMLKTSTEPFSPHQTSTSKHKIKKIKTEHMLV